MEKDKKERPSWDEYFLDIMEKVGTRATCDRGRTGCVVVRNNRILCTGYVGSPIGTAHCDDVGHEFNKVLHFDGDIKEHCIRTVHAEQNAIADAARRGIALLGATIYTKMTPCYTCAKILINAGITRVVAKKTYPGGGNRSIEIFKEAGVKFEQLTNEPNEYE